MVMAGMLMVVYIYIYIYIVSIKEKKYRKNNIKYSER